MLDKLVNNKIDIHGLDQYAAIIGESPSKGARSPELWNAAFKSANLDCLMVPVDVSGDKLIDLLNYLDKDIRFIGGAIAVPYKEAVAEWLGNNVASEAKGIGAVNCLYRDRQGNLNGTNTDGEAALNTFVQKFGPIDSKYVLILGAGGAGKAVASYFANSAKTALVATRKKEEKKYVERIGAVWKQWDEIGDCIGDVDVIINCTSVGFGSQEGKTPIHEDLLLRAKKTAVVFDVIYQPLKTELLRIANNNGLSTFSGLDMNLDQAVLAYRYATMTKQTSVEVREAMLLCQK